MQLVSVNLGQERMLKNEHRLERTGIFKFPVEGLTKVTKLGLEEMSLPAISITVDLIRQFMSTAEWITPGGQEN
jgi:hypothetical protein